MNYHLVILKKPYLNLILEGRKKIELRLFKNKTHEFGKVHRGDRLLLKVSSGPVSAIATAQNVESYENLTPEKIYQLKNQYNHQIGGSNEVWAAKTNSKYGFLVWLENIKRIPPIHIQKKDWRAWVILIKGKDFGLLDTIQQST